MRISDWSSDVCSSDLPWQYTTLRDIFGQFRAEYDIADNALIYAAFGARDGSERGFYQTIRLTEAVTGTATAQGSYIPRTDNNEAATRSEEHTSELQSLMRISYDVLCLPKERPLNNSRVDTNKK